jgi:tocopherol O-methyltransferase
MPTMTRAYYETNTALFERWGGGRDAGSVHRALWAPGVRSQRDALHEAHRRIWQTAARVDALRVLDLGCGIGGALAYLRARSSTLRAVGITLSPAQARRALSRADDALIIVGDYHAAPLAGPFDLAFAIESFAHASDPRRFFASAARCLHPDGMLVIIDDTATAEHVDIETAFWMRVFRDGWHTPSVFPIEAIVAHAARAGFVMTQAEDLTAQLRLRALPDALARALVGALRAARRHEVASASAGSIALQQLYARGAMRYRHMEFRRG